MRDTFSTCHMMGNLTWLLQEHCAFTILFSDLSTSMVWKQRQLFFLLLTDGCVSTATQWTLLPSVVLVQQFNLLKVILGKYCSFVLTFTMITTVSSFVAKKLSYEDEPSSTTKGHYLLPPNHEYQLALPERNLQHYLHRNITHYIFPSIINNLEWLSCTVALR